jgi:hypothetical protein
VPSGGVGGANETARIGAALRHSLGRSRRFFRRWRRSSKASAQDGFVVTFVPKVTLKKTRYFNTL